MENHVGRSLWIVYAAFVIAALSVVGLDRLLSANNPPAVSLRAEMPEELKTALEDGNIEMVEYYIERYPVAVCCVDRCGSFPLLISADNGFNDIARLLLDKGADVNQSNPGGETALFSAARRGDRELMLMLIASGANIDYQDCVGLTPLRTAIRNLKLDAVDLLLDYGADPSILDVNGYTAEIDIKYRNDDVRAKLDYLLQKKRVHPDQFAQGSQKTN